MANSEQGGGSEFGGADSLDSFNSFSSIVGGGLPAGQEADVDGEGASEGASENTVECSGNDDCCGAEETSIPIVGSELTTVVDDDVLVDGELDLPDQTIAVAAQWEICQGCGGFIVDGEASSCSCDGGTVSE